MLRRPNGSSLIFMEFKLSLCSEAWVLTKGGRPSTVTVSVRLPISRACVWRTTCDAIKAMPVLSYVLKPSDSTLSV